MTGYHLAKTPGAMYRTAVAHKRRRCDGHLNPVRHWIEPGQGIIWSALPPGSEVGNTGWLHAAYCEACAPEGAGR